MSANGQPIKFAMLAQIAEVDKPALELKQGVSSHRSDDGYSGRPSSAEGSRRSAGALLFTGPHFDKSACYRGRDFYEGEV